MNIDKFNSVYFSTLPTIIHIELNHFQLSTLNEAEEEQGHNRMITFNQV